MLGKHTNSVAENSHATKRRVSLALLGAACAFSFALGIGLTHAFKQPAAQAIAQLTDKASSLAGTRDAGLLARFDAIDWSQQQPPGEKEIERGMGLSAALRSHVLQQFVGSTNEIQRHQLKQLLVNAPTPELVATAQQWAGDAQSAKNRLNGFLLLGGMRPSEASQALQMKALHNEQEPQVLAKVLWSLARPDVPTPQLANQVAARLHALTQHTHSEVRRASIQRLAEWDKSLRYFPADVQRLLGEPDANVRMSAIGATSIASLNTEPVKQRLLALLGDTQQDMELRNVALMNLPRFDLNEAEYAAYQAGLTQFEKAAAMASQAQAAR
jgi:hypothetical protein